MTRNLSVEPVVDFEPAPVVTPVCAQFRSDPTWLRRTRPLRAPGVAPPPPHEEHKTARAAAAFADVVLRSVLEVVDGRRAMPQLRPLLATGLVDTVLTLARSARAGSARPALLRQVQLRVVDRDGSAAEVFATYARGERVGAIAGRVERSMVRGSTRWQLVALQVG